MDPSLPLILANIIITAFCSIAARIAMARLDPIPFAVLSLSIASALLSLPVLRAGRIALLWDKRYLPALMGLGFLGTTVTSLLLLYAGKTVPASHIVILGQIEILYTIVLGAFVLKEQVGLKQLAATALILSGMLIALGAGRFESFGRGELMILVMPLCFQCSHLIGKRLLPELGPEIVAMGRTVYGLAFLLPLAAFIVPSSSWTACLADSRIVSLILFQGLIINAVSLWLWYTSLTRVDLSKQTTLLLTYPLLTLFIAKFLPTLNEPISPRQFLGAVLVVVGGVALSRLRSNA